MKRVIPILVALILLTSPSLAYASTGEPGTPTNNILIYVNGTLVQFDVQPFIDSQNRTQVPVRFVAESLGYNVDWNQTKQQVSITGNGQEIILTVNSNKATVDGKVVTFDTYVVLKDGRTFVPLRFVSENLGAKVDYKLVNNVNRIDITTTGGSAPATSTITGLERLTDKDVAKIKENLQAISKIMPEDSINFNMTDGGGALLYCPGRKPIGYADSLLVVISNKINPFEVSVNASTWTVPGLENKPVVKDIVAKTTEILKAYLPTGYKTIIAVYDSRKTDASKIYKLDNREVRVAGNGDIYISYYGKTLND